MKPRESERTRGHAVVGRATPHQQLLQDSIVDTRHEGIAELAWNEVSSESRSEHCLGGRVARAEPRQAWGDMGHARRGGSPEQLT